MIDRSLMHTLLTILNEQKDLACGSEEQQLFNDINLRANQPVTMPLIREHILLAKQNGWLNTHTGTLGEQRNRLTPAGRGALSDITHGA